MSIRFESQPLNSNLTVNLKRFKNHTGDKEEILRFDGLFQLVLEEKKEAIQ